MRCGTVNRVRLVDPAGRHRRAQRVTITDAGFAIQDRRAGDSMILGAVTQAENDALVWSLVDAEGGIWVLRTSCSCGSAFTNGSCV